MLAIIFSSVLLLFLFTTFGLFLKRVLKLKTYLTEDLFLGLVGVNTCTCWLSLIFQINGFIEISFVVLSLLLAFYLRAELKSFLLSVRKNFPSHYPVVIFIPAALLLAIGYPDNNDTALYHFQSIKWIEEYAVVPGLANLHGRFGFNPNIFSLDALCAFKPVFGQEIFPLNFTVFLLVVSYLFKNLYHHYKKNGFSNLFLFNFLIFSFVLTLPNLASPAPDFLATLIPLYILTRIIQLSEDQTDLRRITPLFILAVYCLTIKLSVLPIFVLFLLVWLKFRKSIPVKEAAFKLPLIILIVLPWFLRNIILSGWLIYPFPSIDLFNFDWKVPLTKVIYEKSAVTGWARYPHPSYPEVLKMSLEGWVPIWWKTLMFRWKLCVIAGVVFPAIALLGISTRILKIDFLKSAAIATSFLGVIFWFIMAPDPRFGAAFLFMAAFSGLLIIKFSWKPATSEYRYFTGAMFLLLIYSAYADRHYFDRKVVHDMIYSNRLVVPEKIKIPDNKNFEKYPIRGGVVFVPTTGDQCYDHIVPCTPNYDSTLTLRGTSLKTGFKTRIK